MRCSHNHLAIAVTSPSSGGGVFVKHYRPPALYALLAQARGVSFR
jgi:hypothetical protein